MVANHEELANLLQGRTINGTSQSSGETTVKFGDGSKLTVHTPTSASSNSASTGGTIAAVKWTEKPDTLHLETTGGGAMVIPLADSEGGIRLENENGGAEYPRS